MDRPTPSSDASRRPTRWLRLAVACVLLGLLATSAAGCGRQFEPYWRVTQFRVLAIQADPVVVQPGETTTFRALIEAPDDQEVSYRWEWCPFVTSPGDRYECPVTRDDLISQLQAQAEEQGRPIPPSFLEIIPEFQLGTSETAELTYSFPSELPLQLCRGIQQALAEQPDEIAGQIPALDCETGFDVSVRLVAETDSETIIAAKDFTLWTGAEYINTNPGFDDLQIRPAEASDLDVLAERLDWVDPDAELDDQWHSTSPDEPTPVVAGKPFEIRALLDPDRIDVWRPPGPKDSDERRPPESEGIDFRWFVGAGNVGESTPFYKEEFNTIEEASTVRYRINYFDDLEDADADGVPNADDPCPAVPGGGDADGACTVGLWNVARDTRLGLGWIERRLVVVDRISHSREP
jgi:hypothetical protein